MYFDVLSYNITQIKRFLQIKTLQLKRVNDSPRFSVNYMIIHNL